MLAFGRTLIYVVEIEIEIERYAMTRRWMTYCALTVYCW